MNRYLCEFDLCKICSNLLPQKLLELSFKLWKNKLIESMSKGEPLMNTNYSQYDYHSQVDPDEIPDFADPP